MYWSTIYKESSDYMRRYLLQYLCTNSSKRFLTPPRKIHCIAFKGDVDINVFPCYYAQQFFYCVSYRQYLSRPIHQLILNRQGCFIIQQCLLTITLYLFTNKLREYCVANLNIFDLLYFFFLCKIWFLHDRSIGIFRRERKPKIFGIENAMQRNFKSQVKFV